jgi:signal transduction histidine kinase
LLLSHTGRKLAREISNLYLTAAVLVGIYLIVAFLLMFYIIKRILTRPVREMTRLMSRLADGEYNQWYPVKSMDEIGEMGKSVNDLVQSLQSSFSSIRSVMSHQTADGPTFRAAAGSEGNFKELMANLGRAEFELQLLSRKLIEAIEEERKKIADDLHDEIGQVITGIQLDIQYIEQSIENSYLEQKQLCRQVLRKTKELAGTIRGICARLHPELLDDMGLVSAIQYQIDQINERMVHPRIDFLTNLGEMRLDTQTELTIYRIFQEGITNVIKHAQATQTLVGLHLDQPRITLTIRDNGLGFDLETQNISNYPAGKGIGLLSIKERARALGGTVELISEKNRGTQLIFTKQLTPQS